MSNKHCQAVVKRHIESHGYQCIINAGHMAIVIPFNYEINGQVKRGHQIERVTNLKDAYIKMGY